MHSIPHARSLPSLHYVGFIVKSQIITLPDTCQHAGTQEFFTSKTDCSEPSSADFPLLSACLEGMNGVERRQKAQSQAVTFRVELGSSPKGYLAQLEPWTPGRRGGQRTGTQSLCVSLTAVKEVETPVKPTKQ